MWAGRGKRHGGRDDIGENGDGGARPGRVWGVGGRGYEGSGLFVKVGRKKSWIQKSSGGYLEGSGCSVNPWARSLNKTRNTKLLAITVRWMSREVRWNLILSE